MILEEILSKYSQSDFKDFDYNDVLEDFNSVDDSEKAKSEYLYEQLAFRLQPQYGNNPWGHYYYGPQITFRDSKGLPIYSPAIDEITPEVVEYWKKKAD